MLFVSSKYTKAAILIVVIVWLVALVSLIPKSPSFIKTIAPWLVLVGAATMCVLLVLQLRSQKKAQSSVSNSLPVAQPAAADQTSAQPAVAEPDKTVDLMASQVPATATGQSARYTQNYTIGKNMVNAAVDALPPTATTVDKQAAAQTVIDQLDSQVMPLSSTQLGPLNTAALTQLAGAKEAAELYGTAQ
jgi:hypothetical protein